jgi:tRNA G10  N-methylase Trm11
VPVRLKEKENLNARALERVTERLQWIKEVNVFDEFKKACEVNILRNAKANKSYPGRVGAIKVGTDARRLLVGQNKKVPLENESVSLIITSPPYGSAQKYIRATSLSLNWLGFVGPNELKNLESLSIGREHVPLCTDSYSNEIICEPYKSQLERIEKINPTRARITKLYLIEMAQALKEIVRVMAKGGHFVLVSGNNNVCGEVLRNDEYFTHVLLNLGLRLEISLIDHIKSRGLMTKRNKTASVISRESVLVFSKPNAQR